MDRQRDRQKSGAAEEELKVTDRRHFTLEGDPREGAPDAEDDVTEPEEQGPVEETPQAEAPEEGFERRPIEEPEGVDFTMLLNAMVQPALMFLGEIPHPSSGKPEIDLERAQIQIELLDLLRIRCRGNLSREEEDLLDRMLYELRMLYVAQSNKG